MNAEKILDKQGSIYVDDNFSQPCYAKNDVLKAMKEFAEQEAVEFAELLNENFVYVHDGLYRHVATLQDYTITQIYQQFKQRN
jgi:hypothetical protein